MRRCAPNPTTTGRPSDGWDPRDVHLQWSYDLAGRLLTEQATVGGSTRVTERRHYGEGAAAAAKNTRGRLDLQHDDAGTVETEGYDIDGAPIATIRIVRQAYETAVDWVDPGEPTAVEDAREPTAFVYHRDMLGRPLRTENIDAGTKWQGFDLTGRPSDAWDARNVHLHWSYDLAGQLLAEQATVNGDATRVTERRHYGEGAGAADNNTRGRLDLQHDDAGTLTAEGYDIDGEPTATVRILRQAYEIAVDWVDITPGAVAMDGTSHRTEWQRDALGRETRMVAADSVVHLKTYDRLGGLTSYSAEEVGGAWTEGVVDGASYDARGRRTALLLANGASVDAEFDPESHHLARLHAYRAAEIYFDIRRAYSPLGQVVLETDDAHAGGHSELIVGLTASAERAYSYDAFGRLSTATGRVHSALAQGEGRWGGTWGSRKVLLSDGQAVERYQRNYTYNDNSTLTSIQHVGPGGPKWTEAKWVAADSNRSMSQHDFGEVPALAEANAFDAAGHCVRMRHLRTLEWDIAGRLAKITLIERVNEPDEAEFYSYDGDDQRVRRVHHRLANGDLEITDVVYLPGCEIRKVTWNGNARLERKTSGFTVDGERIGELSRWSRDDNQTETDNINDRRMVFRLGGTMGSFGLDLDDGGNVLTYEEYFPYGGVACIGADDVRAAKLRSYRYRGKLRDDATGLYYYGYRYYAPWIGNWISPDPLGPVDGLNVYQFVQGDPVNKHDPDGRQTRPAEFDAGGTGNQSAGTPPSTPRSTLESYPGDALSFDGEAAPAMEHEAKQLVREFARTVPDEASTRADRAAAFGGALLDAFNPCVKTETDAFQFERPAASNYCQSVRDYSNSEMPWIDRTLAFGKATVWGGPQMLAEAVTKGQINGSMALGDRVGELWYQADVQSELGNKGAALGYRVEAGANVVLGLLPALDVLMLGSASAASGTSRNFAESVLGGASQTSVDAAKRAGAQARSAVDSAGVRLREIADTFRPRRAMADGPEAPVAGSARAGSGGAPTGGPVRGLADSSPVAPRGSGHVDEVAGGEFLDDSLRMVDQPLTQRVRGSLDDFAFTDPGNPAKGILAEIDDTGMVTTMIEAGEGATVRGTEMFNMAMRHFGDNVKAVQGVWKYGDNLAEVNRLVSSGTPLKDAVRRTWTARRAAEHGYTSATVTEAVLNEAGQYTSVVVRFGR